MDNIRIAKELLRLAKELSAMEFDSDEALQKYLKEHPDADKSNHWVKKSEPGQKPAAQPEKMTHANLKESNPSLHSDVTKVIGLGKKLGGMHIRDMLWEVKPSDWQKVRKIGNKIWKSFRGKDEKLSRLGDDLATAAYNIQNFYDEPFWKTDKPLTQGKREIENILSKMDNHLGEG